MSQIIDIVMPVDQQEGTENVVAAWLVKPGEAVSENDPVLEISTDKVTIEVAAPASGVLSEIVKEESAEVEPGEVLGRIDTAAQAATSPTEAPTTQAASATASAAASNGADNSAELTPAVRRLVKQHNIDVSLISGSGRGGRISVEDVEAFLAGGATSTAPASGLSGNKIPHTPMRKSIANHMVKSMLQTAPHVTAIFDCDLSAVIAHRAANKKAFADKGLNLTFTAYFAQAAVAALKAVPEVNSKFHEDSLELFDNCNLGIATAIESGLIVPVLKNAESMDLEQTAKALGGLVEKAREEKLSPDEVKDGTFTITNHGVSGSLIATPIINQPQSAILGIGKMEKRAIVETVDGEDKLVIKPMIYVTLTIDHRGLDGFQANTFLTSFVNTLQDWS